MRLPDKQCGIEEAISRIPDGASIMLGGFGVPGTPFCLIEELVRQGQQNLTIIKNDANEAEMGVDWLLQNNQISRLITSHIGLNSNAIAKMNSGEIEVEFTPQGILAERIRVAGAGIAGFLSDVGLGTVLSEGRKRVDFKGKDYLVEPALSADFALLHAERSDTFGNLYFAAAARNFNPLMGMAAKHTIVEAEKVLTPGEIKPEDVHLPGPFVDNVILLSELPEVYHVVKR